jgi:membrane-associated protease RseP (regulator of RpoE activity)
MKHILLAISFACLTSTVTASAAPDKTLERAWMGGEYKLARTSRFTLASSPNTVRAFPAAPGRSQRAGVLIVALPTNTPAALAGLRAGDLILEAGHRPVTSLKMLCQVIDERRAGDTVQLLIFREGEVMERPVVLGREIYRRERSLGVGLLLSGKVDLIPNPDFSLIAAGFQRRTERLELHSPEAQFLLRTRSEKAAASGIAREGWHVWLAIVSFGSHKRILSQEVFPEIPPLQTSRLLD